ncbi:hypothetical protein N9934_04835, partial [Desulfosarcina sp.]|nr:hypothetical protein [Desulfosarcina sp.]
IMRYMGYGWGAAIQNIVEGAVDKVGKLVQKGETAVRSKLSKPKSKEHPHHVKKFQTEDDDFRYRGG